MAELLHVDQLPINADWLKTRADYEASGGDFDALAKAKPDLRIVQREVAQKDWTAYDEARATKPRVYVPDDPSLHGDQYAGANFRKFGEGQTLRGTPISLDDKRIPDTLYHVTTNMPAVTASGMVKAGGAGGLGGDSNDRIVSFTTDKAMAENIAQGQQGMARVAAALPAEPEFPHSGSKDTLLSPAYQKYSATVGETFAAEAKREGWSFKPDKVYSELHYGFSDWANVFFSARERETGKQDPLFFAATPQRWRAIDPEHVGIVTVPKDNLRTGAMVTDFDLSNKYGLKEVRIYGDVPLKTGKDWTEFDAARASSGKKPWAETEQRLNPSSAQDMFASFMPHVAIRGAIAAQALTDGEKAALADYQRSSNSINAVQRGNEAQRAFFRAPTEEQKAEYNKQADAISKIIETKGLTVKSTAGEMRERYSRIVTWAARQSEWQHATGIDTPMVRAYEKATGDMLGTTVWRGVDGQSFSGRPSGYAKLIDKVVEDKGFLSTTPSSPQRGHEFGSVDIQIKVPPGTKYIELTGDSEGTEYLFNRGSKLHIDDYYSARDMGRGRGRFEARMI